MASNFNIILKISDVCPLCCDYCYYFRNTVSTHKIRQPKIEINTVRQLCIRIMEYSKFTRIDRVFFSLHGGEPLTVGHNHFANICEELKRNLTIPYSLAIQSNGVLIDSDWIKLFKQYYVSLGISIDGTKEYQDIHRKFKNGSSCFDIVNKNIRLCLANHVLTGILLVIDPNFSSNNIFKYIIKDLKINKLDLLLRDYTIDTIPSSTYARKVSLYLQEWLKLWLENNDLNVHIRLFDSIIKVLLGKNSELEFGFKNSVNSIPSITVYTDGTISPADELCSISESFMNINKTVYNNTFKDVFSSKVFNTIQCACNTVPDSCKACYLQNVCGGGAGLLERYSANSGFNNNGAYCIVWKTLFKDIINNLLSAGYSKENLLRVLKGNG